MLNIAPHCFCVAVGDIGSEGLLVQFNYFKADFDRDWNNANQ